MLEIYIEGTPLGCFCPDVAIELWWSDCCTNRRVNQQPRKTYQPQNLGTSDADTEEEEERMAIQQWGVGLMSKVNLTKTKHSLSGYYPNTMCTFFVVILIYKYTEKFGIFN